jgi:uroporphyrinogen decarboxylase
MNPRERVRLALNHQEADRTPIDLGATIVSSIVKKTYVELKQHLGMSLEDITMDPRAAVASMRPCYSALTWTFVWCNCPRPPPSA